MHFLTIGVLDRGKVLLRQVGGSEPLPLSIRKAILQAADPGSLREDAQTVHFTLEGGKSQLDQHAARLPWYEPRLNRTAITLALQALDLGCAVADIEHARFVSRGELEGQARIRMDSTFFVDRPAVTPDELDPVGTVDFIFSEACKVAPCTLEARRTDYGTSSAVQWTISSAGQPPVTVWQQPASRFRSCLARIGFHYLDQQVFGGYGRFRLQVAGKFYEAAIFLSNESLSGHWVQAHIGPLRDSPTESPRDAG